MTFRILITNDDGINAPGLVIAEQIGRIIAGESGKVITIAPAVDQSGVGHSISYLRPSLITKHSEVRYSVEGSPADCVLAGIYYVMKDQTPNLILSGINNGHNLSEDILYSGTVGGAMEGAIQGISSIALSQCYSKDSLLFNDKFETARHFGSEICTQLIENANWDNEPYKTFYNINFPAVHINEVKGVSVCKQGRRPKGSFGLESVQSPNGRTFLMVNHQPNNGRFQEKRERIVNDADQIKNNYITISPLKADLTEYRQLEKLEKKFNNDF